MIAVVSLVNTGAIVKLSQGFGGDSQVAQVQRATQTINRIYVRGDRDPIILEVQKALTQQGLYKGDLSGLIGSQTEASIKNFQSKNGLRATGNLDKETADLILKHGDEKGGSGNNGPTLSSSNCNSNTPPWTKVVSPNGGEVFQAGQTLTITWRTCNHPYNVDSMVVLRDDRITDWQLISYGSQPALGFATHVSSLGNLHTYQLSYVIPASFNDILPAHHQNVYGGTHYKIQIITGTYGGQLQEDWSDNLFTINGGGAGTCGTPPVVESISTGTPSGSSVSASAIPTPLLFSFRISNHSACPILITKLQVIPASTNGLSYVNKNNFALRNLSTGVNFPVTNINPPYTNTNAAFTVLTEIPANAHVDFTLRQGSITYLNPFADASTLMSTGGIAFGVAQVDYEIEQSNSGGSLTDVVWGKIFSVTQ